MLKKIASGLLVTSVAVTAASAGDKISGTAAKEPGYFFSVTFLPSHKNSFSIFYS